MMTKIVIVDDHKLLRGILRGLLEAEPGMEVVGEADDGFQGLKIAEEQKPDVLISDLRMDGMDGIELTRKLQGLAPSPRIIILTMYGDPIYVSRAIDAGASGYILKGSDIDELIRAIRLVQSGNQYLSASLTPIVSHTR
jgi:DNA-binding NarL/FixJ family response regulator